MMFETFKEKKEKTYKYLIKCIYSGVNKNTEWGGLYIIFEKLWATVTTF